MDPFVGKRIREYEILEAVGQGRMGGVYRARHVLLEQERAIKIIQTGIKGPNELADRFIRQARILARMRHPNLVELYEFGTIEEGTFFMILELLRGESVYKRIQREEKIEPRQAIKISREAALGLHLAHSMNVVHRDVSPNNLFLEKNEAGDEVVKVIDFAIAKPTAQEARTMVHTPILPGRPEFWSPEQFGSGGKDASLDHRTDIYSLGVTIYNMITGKLPFLSVVPKGTPEPFPTGLIPAKLERVILRAVSLDREARQTSMLDLIAELDEVTIQESSKTVPVAPQPFQPVRFQPGYIFAGRYEIEKKIGKGGMGTVFKATDKILDISVALKTINPDIAHDETTLARLKREVILARKVAHPNVCRIFDIGESEGFHYVSMQYVEGMTLSDMLLVRGKLPQEEGLKILRYVVAALQEAHRAGVIHRDLKPQNIMVDVEGRAFIMDFGISFSADVGRLTTTGMMIGTPRYMAPEQFGDGPTDLRADIYSLGIICYEIFTGRLPFEAKTPANVMYAHIHEVPPKPSTLNPGITPALESLILKALEKNPADRFQRTDQFLVGIDAVLAMPSAPVIEQPAAPEETALAKQPVRRSSPAPTRPQPQPTPAPSPAAAPTPPVFRLAPVAPQPEGSMVAPIALGLLLFLAAAAGAWYYFIRTPDAPPPGKEIVVAPIPKEEKQTEPPPPVTKEIKEEDPAQVTPANDNPEPQTEPVEPAVPLERILKVESVPPGAAIFMDGKETGQQTPADLVLAGQDAHQLELRLEGYQPATAMPAELAMDTWKISLKPLAVPQPDDTPAPVTPAAPGKIAYRGEYPVSIYNNRKLVLNTGAGETAELPAGSYKLRLSSTEKAFIQQNVNIQIKPGETTMIPAPAMARFSLTATPSNCKIYVDTVLIDVAPIFDFPIQAGNHHIRAHWEKLGSEKSVFVTVAPDKSINLRAIADEKAVDIFEEKSP